MSRSADNRRAFTAIAPDAASFDVFYTVQGKRFVIHSVPATSEAAAIALVRSCARDVERLRIHRVTI